MPHDQLAISLRVKNDSLLVNRFVVIGGKDTLGRRKVVLLACYIWSSKPIIVYENHSLDAWCYRSK